MEWKKFLFIILLQMLYFSSICGTTHELCELKEEYSGKIYYVYNNQRSLIYPPECWEIEVPEDNYVRLNVTELITSNSGCHYGQVQISVAGTDEEFIFCSHEVHRKPVIALNDVVITYSNPSGYYGFSFTIDYSIESLICAQKEHFRCSSHSCILKNQVCNDVKDCENGDDEKGCEKGVAAVSGVAISRENAIRWLRKQVSDSVGWSRNTHRAITALYLAGATDFESENVEEKLMAKRLELQTSVALLRNSSDPLSVSDLSMFINALTVTCHNPRLFYGYDLVQILGERAFFTKSPNPAAYLTLCNGNWTFTETQFESLFQILHNNSDYPFHLDIQAMAVMALSCMWNNAQNFETIQNATELYNSAIQRFIGGQQPDGSFGNVYTTALVTQALLSSGQENNKLWKLNSTVKYLMNELTTSIDFLSSYLTLPILGGKSWVDIAHVNCTNRRKYSKDEDISDVTNKLAEKVRIQYSLYVGDERDVIHTMYLRVPENSSAYEVMRLAQVADHKYKFQHRDMSGHMYVYAIAGITNDPEAGEYWLLYTVTGISHGNGTIYHHTKSPDKLILGDGEHLIMWYKTAHI